MPFAEATIERRMVKIDDVIHIDNHPIVMIAFVMIFLAGTLAITPLVVADPSRYFSATITPTSTTVGTLTTFTVTITDNGPHDLVQGNTQSANLQSARITIPSGFSQPASVVVTTSNSKPWSYVITSTTISLNSGGNPNQVPQNGWVKAVFSSAASATGLYTWTCQAWNGNPAGTGTAFTLSGPQPTVTVDKACTTITVTASPNPFDKSHPTTVTVSGDLMSGTTPLGGETVTLSYNVGSGWITFDTVVTTSLGTYSSTKLPANSLPPGPCYIKAVFAGDSNYEGSSSTVSGNDYKLEVLPEYVVGGALLAIAACFASFVVFKRRNILSHLRFNI